MKRTIVILLLLFPLLCNSQDVVREMQQRLDRYNDFVQPEYVEVTLDKDLYFSGEHLWYSIYVSDASYRTTQASAVAYVELRDKEDTVLIRQKIVCKRGVANGDIAIPKIWLSGTYRLVAYTLWMKNAQRSFFAEKRINILNPDYIAAPKAPLSPGAGRLAIQPLKDNTFRIEVDSTYHGDLIAMTREEIFFHEPVNNQRSHILKCEQANSHHVYVALLDSSERIVESYALTTSNVHSRVKIAVDRDFVSPREKIDVNVEIRDKNGNYLPAIFTISARQATNASESADLESGGGVENLISAARMKALSLKKEVVIYPPGAGTLPNVEYSAQKAATPFDFATKIDGNVQQAIMRRKLIRNYGIEPAYDAKVEYNIPFNISFKPSDFTGISTVEDFFREAVAMVKVRKEKDKKILLVRNSDNPSLIYFFKKPPLMLVDGFIVDAEQLLSLSLPDIARIDVTWGSAELNSMNIFSMTDYGVVSITTHSKYPVPGATNELFKGFHTPLIFSQGMHAEDKGHLPRLADPVYWEPNIRSSNRTKISFTANDEPGRIAIRVTGFTETGDYFSAVEYVTVKLRQ